MKKRYISVYYLRQEYETTSEECAATSVEEAIKINDTKVAKDWADSEPSHVVTFLAPFETSEYEENFYELDVEPSDDEQE